MTVFLRSLTTAVLTVAAFLIAFIAVQLLVTWVLSIYWSDWGY